MYDESHYFNRSWQSSSPSSPSSPSLIPHRRRLSMPHHITAFEKQTDSLSMFRIPSPASIKVAGNSLDMPSCQLIIVHHYSGSLTTSRHSLPFYYTNRSQSHDVDFQNDVQKPL